MFLVGASEGTGQYKSSKILRLIVVGQAPRLPRAEGDLLKGLHRCNGGRVIQTLLLRNRPRVCLRVLEQNVGSIF